MVSQCYINREKKKIWNQSTKGKQSKRKSNKKYAQTERGKYLQQKRSKKYYQTEKGKIARRKGDIQSKRNRKHRLGWVLMFENPFDESVEIDYHHITDVYVVAVPKELHQLYGGKYHREKVMEIVKQIYLKMRK